MVQTDFHEAPAGSDAKISHATAPLDAFLRGQQQLYYEELYQSEAVCLGIFRLLPPVGRQIIMHLLWTFQDTSATDLRGFLRIEYAQPDEDLRGILLPLTERLILQERTSSSRGVVYSVNDAFRQGLRNALTGGGRTSAFGEPYQQIAGEKTVARSTDKLVEYGEKTWEAILKYMVSNGAGGTLERPKTPVLALLYQSGLMTDGTDPSVNRLPANFDNLTITSKGFQFLLEDLHVQLWQILMYYVELREKLENKSAEILSLYFTLGCTRLGQDYSDVNMTQTQKAALSDLETYGLVYKRKKMDGVKSSQFYPTSLATSLCSGGAIASANMNVDKRFLILETNYKVYAYTSNELEIAILNLFIEIRVRYPNMVIGRLARDNVKKAMDNGITASQIISYLTSHAHAQMHVAPPPLLHPSVVDQLYLWDKERDRLRCEDALMYDFGSKEMFQDAENFAKQISVFVYSVPERKRLFVLPFGKESMGSHIASLTRSRY